MQNNKYGMYITPDEWPPDDDLKVIVFDSSSDLAPRSISEIESKDTATDGDGFLFEYFSTFAKETNQMII